MLIRNTTLSSAAKTSSIFVCASENIERPAPANFFAPSNPPGHLGKLGEWNAKSGEQTSSTTSRLPFPSSSMNRKKIFLFSSADIASSIYKKPLYAQHDRSGR